jgi:hypothetical protein
MTARKITFDLDATGRPVSAEGINAVAAEVESRSVGPEVQVRITLTPAGDNALYAGTMTALFTLTAPERVPGVPAAEQIDVAATYGRQMIEAMPIIVADVLGDCIGDAVTKAAKAGLSDGLLGGEIEAVMNVIALALLALSKGDKDKAKHAMVELAHGGEVGGGSLPTLAHLSAEARAEAIEKVHAAIDTLAY